MFHLYFEFFHNFLFNALKRPLKVRKFWVNQLEPFEAGDMTRIGSQRGSWVSWANSDFQSRNDFCWMCETWRNTGAVNCLRRKNSGFIRWSHFFRFN